MASRRQRFARWAVRFFWSTPSWPLVVRRAPLWVAARWFEVDVWRGVDVLREAKNG